MMLIQRKQILCDIVLRTNIDRLDYILTHVDKFYKEFKQPKQDKFGNPKINKPQYVKAFGQYQARTINPPKEELKSVQKRINSYLNENVSMPEYAFGGIKGKDNIQNAKYHKGQKYVFQTDLKDFYPFITCKMVYRMFVRIGFSADVSSILTKLTTYKGHLPQGAPTSTTIANLVFEPTGRKLQKLANENKLRFTTFVDDVTMSSQFQFKCLTPLAIQILEEDGYRISQNKTTYKSGITEITGVKMTNNSMTTTSKFNLKYKNADNMPVSTKTGMEQYKNRIKNIARKNHD